MSCRSTRYTGHLFSVSPRAHFIFSNMESLFSTQNLKKLSVFKNNEHILIESISEQGIVQTVKIPMLKTVTTNNTNKQLNSTNKSPSIVRIDRQQDGKQIETRKNKNSFFKGKLTEKQVKEIKTLLADTNYMSTYQSEYQAHKDIGKAYGVTYMTIKHIHYGITWGHVK